MAAKLSRQDVIDILEIIDRSDFDEMHIEMDDVKISLVKAGASALRDRPASTNVSAAKADPRPPQTAAVPIAAADPDVVDIPAPMLGVFFHAAKPGAEPYVQTGSHVGSDTIIGIIEVMKLMNPIHAGIAGEVIEIIAPDGQFVEFGQALLRVRRER